MKIYISGKIAGDPNYKGKFARAAAQLERLGATVINPATAPEGLHIPRAVGAGASGQGGCTLHRRVCGMSGGIRI